MKTLPTEFDGRADVRGYHFRQILREGDFAIYEVTNSEHENSTFDAIHIQNHNGYKIADTFIEATEYYPKSELWGVEAYTALTYNSALKYLKKLKAEVQKRLEQEKAKK